MTGEPERVHDHAPLRSVSGGLDPAKRSGRRRFDDTFQHRWTLFRPFLMHRVEDQLDRVPENCERYLRRLLNRCDDDGYWRGRRSTLIAIFGLSERTFDRRMAAMADARVLRFDWYGDGSGWVRLTGFASLLRDEGGQ